MVEKKPGIGIYGSTPKTSTKKPTKPPAKKAALMPQIDYGHVENNVYGGPLKKGGLGKGMINPSTDLGIFSGLAGFINGLTKTNRTGVKPSSTVPNSPGTPVENPFYTLGRKKPSALPAGPSEKDFASTLADAIAMLREQGGGGGVSYDPYRQSARQNQAEADTNLNAMYTGLANSIAADAPGIQKSYGDTVAAQQGITEKAGQGIQQGYQSANDMLTQQAQALGIQEGVANQINSGQTSAGDAARALADNAGAGATAQTQLNTNRQSALDYNTSVKQAAEQEGAAQRAARMADLQSVLAQLDVGEQEANRSAQGSNTSNALSLAQWLYGNQTDERRYQDSLSQNAAELAIKAAGNQKEVRTPVFNPEADSYLMKVLGYSDPKEYQRWITENPSGYATMLKLFS